MEGIQIDEKALNKTLAGLAAIAGWKAAALDDEVKRARLDRALMAALAELGVVAAPAGGEDMEPIFVLRAGGKGHLKALMAAVEALPDGDMGEGVGSLREFELWEEARRLGAV